MFEGSRVVCMERESYPMLRSRRGFKCVKTSVVGTKGASAGDIALVIDDSRTDLGAEGDELEVGDAITVTAATQKGAFYGTRTIRRAQRN